MLLEIVIIGHILDNPNIISPNIISHIGHIDRDRKKQKKTKSDTKIKTERVTNAKTERVSRLHNHVGLGQS